MTSRPRGRRTRTFPGARRKTAWFGFQTDLTLALGSAAQSQTVLGLFVPDIDDAGKTLLRIIMDVLVVPPATTGDYPFTFGIILVDNDAVAAGATPDPEQDLADPWLVWRQEHMFQSTANATLARTQWHLDIKARRKIGASSDIVAIFESGGMAANVDLTLGGRLLMALP